MDSRPLNPRRDGVAPEFCPAPGVAQPAAGQGARPVETPVETVGVTAGRQMIPGEHMEEKVPGNISRELLLCSRECGPIVA